MILVKQKNNMHTGSLASVDIRVAWICALTCRPQRRRPSKLQAPPADNIRARGSRTLHEKCFDNGYRLPLVTGKTPVTDQVLQMSQER
jgi:hypothetical protein